MGAANVKGQLARCIRLAETLAPRIIDGMSVTELAQRTDISAPNVCRDMDALQALGWAQRLDNGRWALTTKPISLSRACDMALRQSQERQDDFKTNVEAGAFRLLN